MVAWNNHFAGFVGRREVAATGFSDGLDPITIEGAIIFVYKLPNVHVEDAVQASHPACRQLSRTASGPHITSL